MWRIGALSGVRATRLLGFGSPQSFIASKGFYRHASSTLSDTPATSATIKLTSEERQAALNKGRVLAGNFLAALNEEQEILNEERLVLDGTEPNVSPVVHERSFSINGLVRPESGYYLVSPDTSKLRKLIERGEYVFLYGPRGSGKSTYAYHCCRYNLPTGYKYVFVSLEACSKNHSEDFWKTTWHRIHLHFPICKPKPVTSSATFIAAVSLIPSPFVMILDEMDAVLGIPHLREELLHTLRQLKTEAESASFSVPLKAVVALGPQSIVLDMFRLKVLSPFNASLSFAVPPFLPEENLNLFTQFLQTSKKRVDPKIIEHIHKLTGGHKGYTGFCGRLLERRDFTYEEWVTFAGLELPDLIISTWTTAYRLRQALTASPTHLDFMRANFLPRATGFKVVVPLASMHRDTALGLTSDGLLETDPDRQFFWIPSPLVRAIIEASALPNAVSPKFIGLGINFADVVITAIQRMDGRLIKSARGNSFDGTSKLLKAGNPVPAEEAYSFAWKVSAKALVSSVWGFSPFAKISRKSCDLVVHSAERNPQDVDYIAYAVEFCSHVRETDSVGVRAGTLQEHMLRTAKYYRRIPGVKSAWVINFTTAENSPSWLVGNAEFPERPKHVNVVHVFHHLDWSVVKCRLNEGEWIPLVENGKRVRLPTKFNKDK